MYCGLPHPFAYIGNSSLPTVFPFRMRTDTVTYVAGTTDGIADNKLAAGIGLLTSIAMDAERIIKTDSVPGANNSVFPNFY